MHTLTNIQKIVSGMDEESVREIKKVYDIVIKAGTFPVSTIKTPGRYFKVSILSGAFSIS